MTSFLYTPNEDQLRAIHATAKGIRIVAPAGSGKTDTLVLRAIRLIESKRVQPQRILVLSFDNSARQAFMNKFKRFAPEAPLPEVTTINRFGASLLRRHFPDANGTTGQNDSLRAEFDRDCSNIEVLHWDGRYRKVTDVFDAFKHQGYSVEDLKKRKADARDWLKRHVLQLPEEGESLDSGDIWDLDEVPDSNDQFQADIEAIFGAYSAYESRMRENHWLDFADQILRPLTELRRHEDVRDRIRSQYDEIVVDECQDINRLEALMVRYVLKTDTTLVVSGDDDQALYEFRQANSLYLREPSRYFARSFETIDLNVNYRTPQEILAPALQLIAHNNERLPKSPHSGVHHQGTIETLRASTDAALIRRVLDWVKDLLDGKDLSLGTIAPEEIGVLCGRKQNVTAYRNGLTRMGLKWAEVPRLDSSVRVPPGVMVDTMLKAKGRQWKVVILPDASDAVIPGPQSMRLGTMEAERRKFYVSMTRASHQLVVGYASRESMDVPLRTSEGEIVGTNGASRFLFEAGVLLDGVMETDPVSVETQAVTPAHMNPEPPLQKEPVTRNSTQEPPRSSAKATPASGVPATPAPAAKGLQNPNEPLTSKEASSNPGEAQRDWEVRSTELRALEKARKLLAGKSEDHTLACLTAFPAIEAFILRNLSLNAYQRKQILMAGKTFRLARDQQLVDEVWGETLLRWNTTRIHAKKALEPLGKWDQAIVEEMVRDAPLLFQHIAGNRVSERRLVTTPTANRSSVGATPRLQASFTDPKRLVGIERLSYYIQTGLPHPLTNKPVTSLRFDPHTFREEMLILQLHFLMRDIRFYIDEEYRWSTSPILARLSVKMLQFTHPGIRPNGRHLLQPVNGNYADALLDTLVEIVSARFPLDCYSALLMVMNDAAKLQNGNYPTGFKIRAHIPEKPQ